MTNCVADWRLLLVPRALRLMWELSMHGDDETDQRIKVRAANCWQTSTCLCVCVCVCVCLCVQKIKNNFDLERHIIITRLVLNQAKFSLDGSMLVRSARDQSQ